MLLPGQQMKSIVKRQSWHYPDAAEGDNAEDRGGEAEGREGRECQGGHELAAAANAVPA